MREGFCWDFILKVFIVVSSIDFLLGFYELKLVFVCICRRKEVVLIYLSEERRFLFFF